jgi:hypothetical protein
LLKRRDFVMKVGGATAALPVLSAAGIASAAHDSSNHEALAGAVFSRNVLDPSYIDSRLDSRSVSFENPKGARGAGGKTGTGRKGHPFRILEPGESVVLADIAGPGTLRHFWTTVDGMSPDAARAIRLEMFYDGLQEPSICVPLFDFFGLPHGRLAEYYSALISVNNGRGLNSHIPMPFRDSVLVRVTNESHQHIWLFYQIDYTLEPRTADEPSYLHVSFRRENPTVLRRDFVIAEGLEGPGRFLGCAVGIRVVDEGDWYGEGEVKIYRDGDNGLPTYCGTGLEDYVGAAWGMERHYGPYSGVPINVLAPSQDAAKPPRPDLVGFYRWHLPDPIMFSSELRVRIQQIGSGESFKLGQQAAYAAYKAAHMAAGPGWASGAKMRHDSLGFAIVERRDDYCATAFVYCRRPQAIPRYKTELAVSDIGSLPAEKRPESPLPPEDWERFTVEMKQYWGGSVD